mmetsp:Transcript_48097/g.127423  ORF Transcript_48097/g.127423 Transcript_48097/m.127423 type:complete len:114 (+) Transcript_48097:169-510(+)
MHSSHRPHDVDPRAGAGDTPSFANAVIKKLGSSSKSCKENQKQQATKDRKTNRTRQNSKGVPAKSARGVLLKEPAGEQLNADIPRELWDSLLDQAFEAVESMSLDIFEGQCST